MLHGTQIYSTTF